jgi:hypothetical protein
MASDKMKGNEREVMGIIFKQTRLSKNWNMREENPASHLDAWKNRSRA